MAPASVLRTAVSAAIALAAMAGGAAGRGPAATPACVIHSSAVKLEWVTVRPDGGDPFKLSLAGVPADVHVPRRRREPTVLHVRGPLAFRAERENVWLWVTRDLTLAGGMVTVKRGTSLVDAVVGADGMITASAVLAANDVLTGENKEPDEVVGPLELPCDAVALGKVASVTDDDDGEPDLDEDDAAGVVEEEPDLDDATWWHLRGSADRVRLRAAPRAGAASIVYRTRSICDDGCFQLVQLAASGGWVKVMTTSGGVTVRGWVERRSLKRWPDGEGGFGGYSICTGHHGGGMWGEGFAGAPPTGMYKGPATIRAGTPVTHGGAVWAHVTDELEAEVRHIPGNDTVELREVKGLLGEHHRQPIGGAVPFDAVTFPRFARPTNP